MLLGISAAALLWEAARRIRARQPIIAMAWWAVFGLLLALSLVFPIFGTATRVQDRFSVPPARDTLDGQAYMQTASYDWEGKAVFLEPDYRAIRWLEQNLSGTPVVLQAAWEYYRANGVRIAYNTGYPTVLNPLHEDEQRYPEQKGSREQDVYRLYNEPDAALALRLLNTYRVDYVYVGPFERAAYQPAGIEKFAGMVGQSLDLVYDDSEVQIYRLKEESRTASGEVGAPLAVPTVAPAQAAERTEADIRRLRQLADAKPSDAGLQFDLGNRLRQAGRRDEAVEVFKRSLQNHPEDVAMYQTLGDTYQEMGRLDEALAQYQAAVLAGPRNAAAYNKLGMALSERARYDEAMQAFRRCIEIDPNFAEGYFHLGETFERAGRTDEAAATYQELVQTAPNNDWSIKAQARLNALSAGR